MEMQLGSDICSVKRIEKIYQRYGEQFLDRILTPEEKAYVLSSPKNSTCRLAARFAAKEAVAKALGIGLSGISFQEIEIGRKDSGKPLVNLHGKARCLAQELGINHFEITLSHESEYAIAFVLGIPLANK